MPSAPFNYAVTFASARRGESSEPPVFAMAYMAVSLVAFAAGLLAGWIVWSL